MSLEAFIARMPKVELHVHLEGSIPPPTLLALARRHGLEPPAETPEGIRQWLRFRDFDDFVRIYLVCSGYLRDGEDFYLLARDFLAEQARQNILYTEAHFTISTHVANGVAGDEIREALEVARREGEESYGVRLRLIPDIVRNAPPERADVTLEWALGGQERGLVVALGLSGKEVGYPNEPFRDHFEAAARAGLHRVAHAGEHGGPDSVRSVLEICGAERIGHGVRAWEDPALVEELRRRRLPLEICPTSNVCLGVVRRLEDHPFDRLYRAGLEVTVNSDDPAFFDTSLTREYLRLHRAFGYDPGELAGLGLAALRHAFLPEGERNALEGEFRRQFALLGEELLEAPVAPPC